MIRKKIKKVVKEAILELQRKKRLPKFSIPEIQIDFPKQKEHGDYATNIAMQLAGLLKRNPIELAEKLGKELNIRTAEFCRKIEIKRPGFINFKLDPLWLANQIREVIKLSENFGRINIGRGRKIQIEFISANPTGPLTLGNGRGAFFGDVLANVLKRTGFNVQKEYYWNDALFGTQILALGKSIKGEEKIYSGKYIKQLPLKIKKKFKKNVQKLSFTEASFYASQVIKEEIKDFVEKKLKIKFDNWFSESSLYEGKGEINQTTKFLKDKDLVYVKEEALWFKSTRFGDSEDRVLIRKDSTPTYFLSDISYHKNKFKRGFNKVIDIWGADHQGYMKRVLGAVDALGYKGRLVILICQLVRLIEKGKPVRMSKRKGIFVTLEELINEVGLDVARFFFLTKSLDTHLDFDLSLAKEQSQKNPVYYVQYAYARICSILKKAGIKEIKKVNFELLKNKTELNLIKSLVKLPEILEDVTKDYGVQRLSNYVVVLADNFHKFYENCRVITRNEELFLARLQLVKATRIVLKNTLDIMGVEAPEKM